MNNNNIIHLFFSIELLENYKNELINSLLRRVFPVQKRVKKEAPFNEVLGPLFIVSRSCYTTSDTGIMGWQTIIR